MRYRDNTNRRVYEGTTFEEIVAQMHEMSGRGGDDEAWMKEASEGAAEQSGKPVSYESAEKFITDLIAIEFMSEVREGEKS